MSTLVSPDFAVPAFEIALRLAVANGLRAAAILDAKGKLVATAGAFDDHEARAIAAALTHRMKSPDLLERMLDGEMLTATLEDREVSIGVVAKCVFVVVELGCAVEVRIAIEQLRSDVEQMIRDARGEAAGTRPPPAGTGGNSSGPAELPLIEIGVTVRRGRN